MLSWHRITFETRSVRDASTVATPATRDATASAAHIAIGKTHVPMHMSKERFGATSLFASALAKSGGFAETSKLGERMGQCQGGTDYDLRNHTQQMLLVQFCFLEPSLVLLHKQPHRLLLVWLINAAASSASLHSCQLELSVPLSDN